MFRSDFVLCTLYTVHYTVDFVQCTVENIVCDPCRYITMIMIWWHTCKFAFYLATWSLSKKIRVWSEPHTPKIEILSWSPRQDLDFWSLVGANRASQDGGFLHAWVLHFMQSYTCPCTSFSQLKGVCFVLNLHLGIILYPLSNVYATILCTNMKSDALAPEARYRT